MHDNKRVKEGDWALFKGDTLIDSDSDLSRILQKSKEYNEEETVITKEPSSDLCFYWVWWLDMSVKERTYTYKYKLPPGLRDKEGNLENPPTYPLLNIQLYPPEGGKALSFEGLLDSGADGVFIPKQIADELNLEVKEKETTSGILESKECIQTEVGFRIGRSKARRIDFGIVEATFPQEESDIPILVGRNPLFECFEIRFLEYNDPSKIKLIKKKSIPWILKHPLFFFLS